MSIKSYTKKKEKEFNYEVIENFGALGDTESKYRKELRLISWNGGNPVYDLRTWNKKEDGTETCGKGLTLKAEELENLLVILNRMEEEA